MSTASTMWFGCGELEVWVAMQQLVVADGVATVELPDAAQLVIVGW